MNKLLTSIIIPVYKVEAFIVRCIESVLRQTYLKGNQESLISLRVSKEFQGSAL